MSVADLNKHFENYRPTPSYPVYPPYHTGYYLEDYFYHKHCDIRSSRIYIPVFWTTCYIENKTRDLQQKLNELDQKAKYFTISQHDDAIKESLPRNTLKFSAGGNTICENTVPIPLVCSRIPANLIPEDEHRTILASFVGSITHPIRSTLCELYKNEQDFVVSSRGWTPSVHEDNLLSFINITSKSVFTLCPRGYGLNSFRLYEAIQLGSVPVIVTDRFYLPWTDEINWSEISVLVDVSDIHNIKDILRSKTSDEINTMRNKAKNIYGDYFTLDGVCNNIIKRVA